MTFVIVWLNLQCHAHIWYMISPFCVCVCDYNLCILCNVGKCKTGTHTHTHTQTHTHTYMYKHTRAQSNNPNYKVLHTQYSCKCVLMSSRRYHNGYTGNTPTDAHIWQTHSWSPIQSLPASTWSASVLSTLHGLECSCNTIWGAYKCYKHPQSWKKEISTCVQLSRHFDPIRAFFICKIY